jgi:hypothetical protein
MPSLPPRSQDQLEDVSAGCEASPPESRSSRLEIGEGALVAGVKRCATLQARGERLGLDLPNSVRRSRSPIATVLLHRVGSSGRELRGSWCTQETRMLDQRRGQSNRFPGYWRCASGVTQGQRWTRPTLASHAHRSPRAVRPQSRMDRRCCGTAPRMAHRRRGVHLHRPPTRGAFRPVARVGLRTELPEHRG